VTDRPPLNELPIAEAGFGVEPESAGDLAETIEAALSDRKALVAKARIGARLAVERYSRDRVAAEYAALYRSLT
jgi:glycosyltransferase involved in cell wall biosynthesis